MFKSLGLSPWVPELGSILGLSVISNLRCMSVSISVSGSLSYLCLRLVVMKVPLKSFSPLASFPVLFFQFSCSLFSFLSLLVSFQSSCSCFIQSINFFFILLNQFLGIFVFSPCFVLLLCLVSCHQLTLWGFSCHSKELWSVKPNILSYFL